MALTERTIVVALGGNAFLGKGDTIANQRKNVKKAAQAVASLVAEGYRVVVTHGNGPQVGIIAEVLGSGAYKGITIPLDEAVAMTQGWLGYILQQEIGNELEARGLPRRVVTLVTQVEVDPRDEAFSNPTKYIGRFYSEEEAKEISKRLGWVFREDPRGGYRRVVPSPKPQAAVEVEAVKQLARAGYVVVAVGGGGIPSVREGRALRGVEAVIDKDLASAVLALSIGAEALVILTDVEFVYLDFGKPTQRALTKLTVSEAKRYLAEGQFPPGSMGPKVEAAVMFVEGGGEWAAVGLLDKALEVVRGASGTRIVRG
ncbi:MAG: carbamate kinase [Thermoproteota archaeon]